MQESCELSPAECETLLRAGVVGRVALSTAAGPEIFPMNYVVLGEAVFMRTAPDSVLGSRAHHAPLAFEVDQIDHENQRGWSVVVHGTGEWVTDPGELEQLRHGWSPRPWVSGTRDRLLRLPWTRISGRRIGHGWDPASSMPARRIG
ncbi:pyridoxamine 5'-phosphate oxidase family protein [Nocardioides ferulae]|uniref:pyridoxamine 5'-phosphate oxidase family protein n=1 Tax=Nocardioides ferulae TaxID=2340821 RepID=UPI000EAC8400|nr:pyridoxamine 5'-phosphate oxidase family protein [Nocardioides ferulae]